MGARPVSRKRRFLCLFLLAAPAAMLALAAVPTQAEAALAIAIVKALNLGICEQRVGPVVVLHNSSSQSGACGSQNAGVVHITGGAANQLVTLTLPAATRTLRAAGQPNITVSTFTFATSSGLNFNTNTGSFNLDGAGTMTVYIGVQTAAALPAGVTSGAVYAGTATVRVV